MTEGPTEPAQLLPACAEPGPGHEGCQLWGQAGSTSDLQHNPRPCFNLFRRQVTFPSLAWRTHPYRSCGPCSRYLQLCFALVSASPLSAVPRQVQVPQHGALHQGTHRQCQGSSLTPSQTNSLGVTFSHSPVLLAKGQGARFESCRKLDGWTLSMYL